MVERPKIRKRDACSEWVWISLDGKRKAISGEAVVVQPFQAMQREGFGPHGQPATLQDIVLLRISLGGF
jgi:hypothetical protein